MKFPLLGKTLAVTGVLIALTLALQSISAIVSEREGRLHEAERSVADSLASQQSLLGPALPLLPGTEHASPPRGFHAVIPAAIQSAGGVLQAEVALDLVGTGDLAFAPVADTTTVALASDWPHPSFAGRFLPNDRTINA